MSKVAILISHPAEQFLRNQNSVVGVWTVAILCVYCAISADACDIFEMCRLEYGVYRRSGDGGAPWCAVLTPAMIHVLEYHDDLQSYWTAGYGGDDVSYTPACTLVADLLQHLLYDTHKHTR